MMLSIPKQRVMQCLWILAGVVIAVMLGVALLGRVEVAYSLGLGFLSVWLPLLWFTHRCFATTGALAAQRIVRSFYRAEAEKWALTIVLVSSIFGLHFGMPDAVLAGYIATQIVWWLLVIIVNP